jgi:MinD-like ATPase involved in chromosome partitioning or flagellar assembly
VSQSSSEEQPLTAAAFTSQAASRRDVPARVIRAVPPASNDTSEDVGEDAAAESEPAAAGPPSVGEPPPDPSTRVAPVAAAPVPPVAGAPAPGPQGPPPVAYQQQPQQPYGPGTGQWAYGPGAGAPGYGYPQTPGQPGQQYAPQGQYPAAAQYPQGAPVDAPPAAGFGEQPPEAYGFEQFAEQTRQAAPQSPATWGWRGRVRRMTGGLISPAAGEDETAYRAALAQVQAGFTGPKTITFVNPKGGAGTTTSVLMAARTFGVHRGGGVVAWDNNETRGTLGERGMRGRHMNTARELLDNIATFEDSATARIGDLGLYLRSQGAAHFDLLASDERPEVTGHIDHGDVARLHGLFQRFYRLILIDTGNNMRAGNWLASVNSADLIVVTTTIRQDSASSALWMLDALEKGVYGPGNLKPRTITVLSEPASNYDPALRQTMLNVFGARTRGVYEIPFEPALVDGGVINYDRISPRTERAWLVACAAMAAAL